MAVEGREPLSGVCGLAACACVRGGEGLRERSRPGVKLGKSALAPGGDQLLWWRGGDPAALEAALEAAAREAAAAREDAQTKAVEALAARRELRDAKEVQSP